MREMREFDVIVVGGGSAGCAAAAEIAADPRLSVCLVEAGGRNDDVFIKTPSFLAMIPKRSNWAYDTEPMAGLGGRTGYQPRGRGLGGSSAINAMVYIRGNRWDYDNWAALGCPGWSYDDVLPVFRRQENNACGDSEYHGAAGPLHVSELQSRSAVADAFVEAASHLQLPLTDDFNGARQEGFGPYQVTQKDGERWSAARAFVDPLAGKANVHVETGALVERLEFADGRVTGVRIVKSGRSEVLKARGGVVLSAGAFGSPQILMLSGIGPAAHLAEMGIAPVADRAAVGADLQDHCDYVAGYELDDLGLFGGSLRGLWNMAKAFYEHRRHRTGMLTSNLAETGGFLTIRPDSPAPDVQFHFVRAIVQNHGRDRLRQHGFSLHVCVLRPESRGWVKLRSPDPATAPAINPNFLADPRDLDLLREGARVMHRIATTPPMADLGAKERFAPDYHDDADLDRRIREVCDTIYHPVGTCRMGSDEDAVVDPKLKARGVDGLWIADASIMPRLISGNTNAPSIMIGGRCGEWVREALH